MSIDCGILTGMARTSRQKQLVRTVPRRVVVALRMAGIAGQDKLNGIFEHLSAGHRWQLIIYRTRHEFTAEVVRHELARKTDGFIVGIPDTDDALAVLAASRVPTVVMNVSGGGIEKRKDAIAFVKSDSTAVGREAAHTLLRQGVYKSYGYAGYRTDEDWSRDRGEAFRTSLHAAEFVAEMFDRTHHGDKVEDSSALAAWLANLPKPCGILAACDDRAFEILDICRERGIKVPAEIGILGVNNDRLVQKVLAYISREAVKGIGVEDVARRFKVSRSLLELRFGELQGESVYEAMLRIRLEEVKRLLRNTDEPIAAITAACGWENPAPPKALFKRRFGMSMRDWRASAHR